MIKFTSLPRGARNKILAAGYEETKRLQRMTGAYVDMLVVEKLLESVYIAMSEAHIEQVPPTRWQRLRARFGL